MPTPTSQQPFIATAVRRDDATAAFFDATRRGEFYLRRSNTTGEVLDPRTEQDSAGNTDLTWIAAAGTARVVSWAEVPQRVHDDTVPPSVIVAIVEFDEGPWWWTQLVGIDAGDLTIGMAVRVRFVKSGADPDDEYVPVFTKAEAPPANTP